jgi:hypothetical protein
MQQSSKGKRSKLKAQGNRNQVPGSRFSKFYIRYRLEPLALSLSPLSSFWHQRLRINAAFEKKDSTVSLTELSPHA